MSNLDERFTQASEEVKNLPERPDNETLLKLYSLFKQGTKGDVSGPVPGIMDFAGRAKYQAWERLKGSAQEEAQQSYIDLVDQLKSGT